MLRIETEENAPTEAEVTLSGSVTSDSIPSVRDVVYDLTSRVRRVVVDLEKVTTIDRAALEFFAAASRDGVYLKKPTAFVREWLKAESRSRLANIVVAALLLASPTAVARAEGPLTMDSAVEAALGNNRSLASARIDAEKAEERLAQTKTKYLPSLSFDMHGGESLAPFSIEIEKGSLANTDKTGPVPTEDTEIDVARTFSIVAMARVSQPVSQLWEISLNVDQAANSVALEHEKERDTRQETARATKLAYFNVVQAERVAAAAAETVAFHKELVRSAEEQRKRESVLEVDLLQARARLAGAELNERIAKNSLATSRQRLNKLLGRDVDAPLAVAGLPAESYRPAPPRGDRPDVRQAELRLEAAARDVRIKQADLIPDVSLTASYLRPINADTGQENFTFAGVSFSWEPFTWGRREAEVREKKKAALQAALTLDETRANAAIDVADRARKLEQSSSTIEVRALEEDAAREKLRVVHNKFAHRAAELSDVLGAASSLADATTQHDQALVDWWSAKLDYEKALGEE